MKKARINGAEHEYEVKGSGEPLLLISPVLADGFVPLIAERALADRYRVIVYDHRGAGLSEPRLCPQTAQAFARRAENSTEDPQRRWDSDASSSGTSPSAGTSWTESPTSWRATRRSD